MKVAKPASVETALAAHAPERRAVLDKIRTLLLKAVPAGEERISYGMPALFLDGRLVACYDVFKDHLGFYPPVRGDAALREAAAPYAGPKGNLRFPLDKPLPTVLIRRIAAGHVAAVRAAGAAADGPGARARTAGSARRARHPMPAFIRDALAKRGLEADYRARPPYQRNDYVGWITGAKTEATRAKRLTQMLDELERGGVYMRMKHPASARR